MANYVISDIHGHYDYYLKMLEKINFSDSEMLYILGDVVDRGPHPVKILQDLMKRSNVCCIAGNHEVMFCECMKTLLQEITEESIADIDEEEIEKLINWQQNGSATTTDEFHKLSRSEQKEIAEFVSEFEVYEEVHTAMGKFLLVHAGLGNFEPDKELWEYELDELVWKRPDYGKKYFEDIFIVSGHTPTLFIKENPRKGFIYQSHNNIVIDCGCGIPYGRLGCLRLDDMKEFYVEAEEV